VCTLSVLARRGGGCLLAMNRDERTTRGVARPPELDAAGATTFLAPRDADAGGTWIAVDRGGRTLCLLNGDRVAAGAGDAAEAADPHVLPSRGRLIPELIGDPAPAAVARELRGRLRRGTLRFRPFQLVAIDPALPSGRATALAISFDGRELHEESFVAPFVLTSNGFDPDGVARARRARFDDFLASRLDGESDIALRDALLELHASHSAEAPRGGLHTICMHRPEVRTVSVTLVETSPAGVTMVYRPGQPCERAPLRELSLR